MAKIMWTRADAQAEMARAVAGTLEARKTLHRAFQTIARLGEETGFRDDAVKATELLRQGALGEPKRKRPCTT